MPRIRLALLSAGLLSFVLVPSASQATAQVRCQIVDFAPSVARSHHALCVDLVRGPTLVPGGPYSEHVIVRISTDDGRTWSTRTTTGIPERPDVCEPPAPSPVAVCQWGTHLASAFHSSGWATDKTLYLGIRGAGLLRSTDDGTTWSLVALAGLHAVFGGFYQPYHDPRALPLSENASNPVAYVNNATLSLTVGDPLPPERVGVVDGPERIDPPVERPVPGTGEEFEQGFLFPYAPHGAEPGLGVGFTFGEGSGEWDFVTKSRTRLHLCDYDLSCPQLRHDFGPGQEAFVDMASDYSSSGVLFSTTVDWRGIADPKPSISYYYLRSADAGRHFTRWDSVEVMRKPARALKGGDAIVSFATRQGSRRDVAALVEFSCDTYVKHNECSAPRRPADYQVMISHDNGSTWRRVASFDDPGHLHGHTPAPWFSASSPASLSSFQLGPDGRLLIQARVYDSSLISLDWNLRYVPKSSVLWCSTDGGRGWSSPCRK